MIRFSSARIYSEPGSLPKRNAGVRVIVRRPSSLLAFVYLATVLAVGSGFESIACGCPPQDLAAAKVQFNAGDYEGVIEMADSVDLTQVFLADGYWPILKARAQLRLGRYEAALQTIKTGIDQYRSSIQLRWLGIEASNYNDDSRQARDYLDEITTLWNERSWSYTDAKDQIVIGQLYLEKGFDAKQVLTKIFGPVRDANPDRGEIYFAMGQLALEKNDYGLAVQHFEEATKRDPNNPDGFFYLAMAAQKGLPQKANESLAKAFALNPRHAPSLLFKVDNMIDREAYESAVELIDKIHAINPEEPNAWAYRAVVAHLQNDPTQEAECRRRALKHWRGNPHIDFLIGKKLSQKYRFSESEAYQRRSLVYDEDYLPAKIQLAHDLLRLGQELEGWKLAEEVFDADQYSVVANNLVNLRDQLAGFQTLERDGFVVRMSQKEANIYGEEVLALLSSSKKKLVEKYQVELEIPIFVEIFPEQQDFAIRTFSLPGGQGFLGVCFGRLITMNSPAAQGASLTNWKSVLWHEFCHVVTLQKTKNKMPRWLSEGISVYEERLEDPAWGQSMNSRYREMILGDDLTPVSKLSGAFLSPPSPKHLDFAYFESSLVVEYLIDEYGLDSLNNVLNELGIGTPINDALRRHTAPVNVLDKAFATYARQRAETFAANADWTQPELPADATPEDWKLWNEEHPNNFAGMIQLAQSLTGAKRHKDAIKTLDQIRQFWGERGGAAKVYALLYANYRVTQQNDEALKAVKKWAQLDASSSQACIQALQIVSQQKDWAVTKELAKKLLGINPLIKVPHEMLATAAEKTNDNRAAVQALSALAIMEPFDEADIQFRLAKSHFALGNRKQARRAVLLALEQAPRFRDAQSLLLRIIDSQQPAQKTPSQEVDQ